MDHFGNLRGHYGLQTASEVKSDLIFQISDPSYLLIHMHIAYMEWTILAASEVTTASKQPRRSSLISDLNSVTPITYLSMCILLILYGPFWQPRGHYSLQTASEVKSDFIFQISDLNYICCHIFGCSNLPYFVNTWRRRRRRRKRGIISH